MQLFRSQPMTKQKYFYTMAKVNFPNSIHLYHIKSKEAYYIFWIFKVHRIQLFPLNFVYQAYLLQLSKHHSFLPYCHN
jgi:hypothetical protein